MSGRYYTINDESYPSVTTILRIINKEALLYYFGKYGTKKAQELSKTAMDLGSEVHKKIERFVRAEIDIDKGYLPISKEAEIPFDAFLNWIMNNKIEWLESEKTVHSDTHSYAGTLDAVAIVNGEKCIIDFKTSAGFYPEYELQLEAYRYAWTEMKIVEKDAITNLILHKKSVHDVVFDNIRKMLCVRLDKKSGKYEVKEYEPNIETFDAFLAAKKLWEWYRK